MNSSPSVACLYSAAGLATLADREKVVLTGDANRTLMSIVLSKVGPTVGQKIVKNCKLFVRHKQNTWGMLNLYS